ncbi:RFX DNA-binding domain-containing protein [Ditylenchus destructor]|uniref:RFX DNA-binding domain-containing protein n=1 Tax=Ditylenchus destructor TaxID=166010 RepID=A0AAD4R9W0_9BILA|nr:RFX DNA-binding domain-containing protein [Ditylenchus destructor]
MELPPFLANTSSSSSSSTLVAVCPSTNCPTSHSPSCSLTAHPMIVGAPNWVPHTATGLDGSEKAIIIGGDHQCTMLQVGNQHDHKYIMISPGVPQTTTAYSHQNPTVMCCGSSVHGHVHHHTEMIIDNGDMGQMTSSNMDPQDISVGITDLNGSKFRKLNFYPESHLHKLHYQPIHSPNSNGNANYVVQNSQAPSSPAMSGDDESSTGGQISHMARTPPETLEWLNNNYEASEGASLPRCTLYDHYLAHCEELNLRPVNAASFGKLIRSVFQKLKTRRLGTRGNSKYHYNGIRIKATSNLLNFVSAEEYNRMNATTNQTARNTRRSSSAQHSNISQQGRASSNSTPTTVPTSNYQLRSRTFHSNSIENGQQSQLQYGNMSGQESMNEYSSNVANSDSTALYNQSHNSNNEFQPGNFTRNRTGSSSSQIHEPRRASRGSVSGSSSSGGAGSEPEAPVGSMAVGAEGREVPRIPMPNIEEMEEYLLPLGYTISHVLKFMDAYTENCQKILNCMKNLQFDAVEGIWARFWQGSVNDQLSSDIDMTDNSDGTPTVNLDQAHIYGLCTLPQLQKYIETMDLAFYQVIVEVLIPDVLRTDLSPQLSVQIRNFAKSIEQWCMKAIVNAPSAIKKSKLESIRLLSNTLTRYTCFNHLTSAAKSVLENKEQIAQMYNDFCRVDFPVVHSQTEWICGCDSVFITSIERAFKENLRLHKNLDEWTEWLEAVVDQALAKYHDKPIRVLVDASKQFLLKWSFYSSMILRDVTYRSAQSFGSFHLIRLLYDEYMFLLVEMRLAKATNQPMIGVMGQKWLRGDSPSEFCSTPGLQNSAFTVPLRDPQTTTMITLNGCNSHSTTAYVTPASHLGEPTYTHIHNTPLTASTSMTMAIPSHSGGIQYVIDHSTISPKYSALHTSSSQAPAHLTDILVRDDPSLASIAHHSIGANFGHEIANSGSNSR